MLRGCHAGALHVMHVEPERPHRARPYDRAKDREAQQRPFASVAELPEVRARFESNTSDKRVDFWGPLPFDI